jgi:rhodanese-related sulfurtransferase
MPDVIEITPAELKSRLQGPEPPAVVDVREPWEVAICSLEGSLEIPLRSLPQRLQEIPRDRTVAVICHAGMRSYMAAGWLAEQGYDAVSLAGGIDRWAVEVDRTMARY